MVERNGNVTSLRYVFGVCPKVSVDRCCVPGAKAIHFFVFGSFTAEDGEEILRFVCFSSGLRGKVKWLQIE